MLEFISLFVNHEIMDDGEPAVGYCYYDGHNRPCETPCGPDHPRAMPYLHRSIDLLVKTRPDAEPMGATEALKVLAWYEARAARIESSREKRNELLGKNDPPSAPNAREALRIALAAELWGVANSGT